jgi:tRNA pseudouridine38-40 synthase
MQPNGVSVQQKIQEALKVLMKEDTPVTASGRTDAGVHAYGQTAHFSCKGIDDEYRFLISVNGILPNDIKVHDVEEVGEDFHARYGAKGKTYRYNLCISPFPNPFQRRVSCHVRQKVDMRLLREASKLFVGTHDFTSFANEAHRGRAAKNAVRTISRLDVIEGDLGMVSLEFEGNGFLYKMVRNIVGTLLEVAIQKRPITEIAEVFAAKDRRRAGKAASAHGLFLVKVHY